MAVKSKNRRTKSMKKNPARDIIIRDIIALSVIFYGIYMFYFLMAENAGAIGNFMSSGISFLFGRSGYFLAFVLVVTGILIIFGKDSTLKKRVVAAGCFLILVISMLFSIIDGHLVDRAFSAAVFELSHSASSGGGILGAFTASLSVNMFSMTGTVILMILLVLVSGVLVTPKSLYEYLSTGGQKLKVEKRAPREKNTKVQKTENRMEESKNNPEQPAEDVKQIKILDYAEIRPISKHENIKNEDELKKTDEASSVKPIEKSYKKKKIDIEKEEKEIEKLMDKLDDPITYDFPSIEYLDKTLTGNSQRNKKEVMASARLLEKTLGDFGVKAKVSEVSVGPTVTRYELQPEPGVKVSKIVNLSNDLALSLATSDVRIEAPIPGKAAIGIEVPNKDTDVVHIREIIESSTFERHDSKISFALGKKLSGSVVVADIAKMPHLLIAGATGAGKSVCINSIIISILYKATPEEVKLILIDPKMVELNNYNGIPHLLIPVVTDPKHAAGALNWGIKEMTERYKAFKDAGVRDIIRFNELAKEKDEKPMPRIVIIIDELADLMMVSPREVENAICRLAQLARAAGIHLVLATQRPSVDVITGLIKANIPSRISFSVSSMMDSRTILDMGGAEKLLGRGDMLYYPVGEPKPIRLQGTFISDKEVERVVDFVKRDSEPQYREEVIEEIKEIKNPIDEDFEDDMLPKAIELALENGSISTSQLQRKLRLGYSRAGRIIDEMEERGIISGPDGSKPRKVLIDKAEFSDENSQE
ncbi:FtsK/SpoIIIE family DNA translocase [Alkalibacter saccharofermentans]|uniref:DNA segregation ATPase FtsK/SpoIIIE, S-DNA-T family n=1 Tax=Alkalibacter saccharofermentans DSM 14828 TaxID=1120975 RepID=A0A1M4SE20_9FIRM|nr:DNA translocase FtsK [Alkalibacter saccharofermentans]SHE30412.1 DNA segregation ATPase FtsK/SpoIIIE, S-DNA-T family [Alkalibacter saccharofermentans DSM 14828]